MAVSKIRKISSWFFIVTIIISILVFGIYYGGGNIDPTAETPEPVYTDVLLFWLYTLFGIVVGFTLFFAGLQMVRLLKEDPKSAALSIGAIVLLVAMLFITYTLGDDTPLVLPGYDGNENVAFWLKLTDMWLYSLYTMLFVNVAIIVWGNVKRALGK